MERKFSNGYLPRYILLFLLISCVSVTFLSFTFKYVKFAAGADEGYYLRYATYIAHEGPSGISNLFKYYFQNQTNWLFPNPLRIGFIFLSSLWLRLFGYSFINLSYLSLFSFCLFLVVCFYFVRKYFQDKVALSFIILLASSPLNMAMARRALIESPANLFTALSIWLFIDFLRERSNLKLVFFIIVYAFTILIKEISVLLLIIFMFYLLIHKLYFKKAVSIKDSLCILILPVALVGIVYVSLSDLSDIFFTVRIILNSPKNNQYAILFGSGPWFRYVIDFILLSPWVCILAIGFIFFYITKTQWQEEIFYLLFFSMVSVFLLSFFTKNVRYLIFLDMPMRLFAVLMLKEIGNRLFKGRAFVFVFAFVIMIAFLDVFNFYNLFIRHDIYDPVSHWLLQAYRIIPWK